MQYSIPKSDFRRPQVKKRCLDPKELNTDLKEEKLKLEIEYLKLRNRNVELQNQKLEIEIFQMKNANCTTYVISEDDVVLQAD